MSQILAEQFSDSTHFLQTQIDAIKANNELGYIYSYPDKRLYQPIEDSQSFIEQAWQNYEGPVGVYVHVPWCTPKPPTSEDIQLMQSADLDVKGRDHLCSYCNLYTAVRKDGIPDWYPQTLQSEIDLYKPILNSEIKAKSLYFGGGSPSLLDVDSMEQIVNKIEETVGPISFDEERAIEVIPDSVDSDKLAGMRNIFNRISVGVQSFDPQVLRSTGRDYDPGLAQKVITEALAQGYDDVNGDLIIGLQNSTHGSFVKDVHTMIDTGATTVTLYQNMIRQGTRAGRMASHHMLTYPSQNEIYDWTQEADELLAQEGFQRLSLTCWTKNGKGYQQGEQIYQQIPIIGFGAGARSYGPNGHYAIPYTEDVRLINNAISRWHRSIDGGNFPDIYGIEMTPEIKVRAELILGLMSQTGVSEKRFNQYFHDQLLVLTNNNLVHLKDGNVFYTQEGKALSGALSSLFYSENDTSVTEKKNAIRTH